MADEQDKTPPEEAIDAADAAKAAADQVGAASQDAPPSDDAEDGLAAAKAAVADAASMIDAGREGATEQPADAAIDQDEPTERLSSMELPSFDEGAVIEDSKGIDLLSDVNLNVSIELGRTRMHVEDVLKLNEGAVVELDKLAGDPVDVYVNDRLVARGEVLVLNDTFCIRVNEIVKQGADIIAEAG